jgi:16S rRNA (cytosine967-C5)-methyltransferase
LNAREVALKALLRVDENEGYSNLVLDKALRSSELAPRDKALTSALFYGTLERRITLDAALRPYLRNPKDKLNIAVKDILRMAAYQIYYMDRIPDSAAVNEAVFLTKEAGKEKAAGFVNGLLRNLLRQKEKTPFPPQQGSRLQQMSVRYSCPEWLIERWEKTYGTATVEAMLQDSFSRPPLYARVNTLKTSSDALIDALQEEGITAKKISWLPDALELTHTGSIAQNGCFQKGLFHIQDLASQLCCHLLGAQPGEHIYDVCAAPGGKTFTIAQLMRDTGEIHAFDQYRGKVGLIRKGADRLGICCVTAAMRDAVGDCTPLPPADRVLCDVPCSGYGILRRKPEIRYKSRETIDSLPDLQYRILCKSAALVRQGGTLLYSTCTLNPMENGGNAGRFLREHLDFRGVSLCLSKGVLRTISEPDNQLTLFPQTNHTDGFFISVFRKEA